MSTTTATAKGKFDPMPTKAEIKDGGSLAGGVALGIIASHAALNILKKQDSAVVNGVLAAGGLYGAMKVKNPLLKAICAGAAAYGAIKLVNKATAAVATPGATEGLAGMLPEGVKDALRKYIPTFAGIDEVAGLGNPGTNGADDEFNGLSLDDQGMEGVEDLSNVEDFSGVGNLAA